MRNGKSIVQSHFLIRLGLFVLISFLAMVLTIVPGLVYGFKSNMVISISIFVIGVGIYAAIICFLYRFWQKHSQEYAIFKKEKRTLFSHQNVITFIIAFVIYLIYHVVVSHYFDKVDHVDQSHLTWYMICIMFVFQVICAPLIEELITRGIFFSLFFREDAEWNLMISLHLPFMASTVRIIVAAVISAFLSSTLHGAVTNMAMYGLILNGFLCVWLYQKTKHIGMPILLHMINNLIVIIGMILALIQK